MADPKLVATIGVKVGTTANVGEFVILRNLTRGGKLTGAVKGTDRSIVFNPAPSTQWEVGDQLQAEIRGRIAGVKQEIISKARGAIITISASTDTNKPGVSL